MKNSLTIPMTHSGSEKRVNRPLKWYNNLLAEFKRGRTGYSSVAIIPQSCIGSVAAMMLLLNGLTITNLIVLFVVTILSLTYNGAVLAQLKPKLTFNLLILSLVFNSIVIIAHLF